MVNESILEEVRRRLDGIDIDGILESGYIEEFIEDTSFSPFPQVQNTERPDVVAAALPEGKIAVITDGTPFVLIVPMTFWTALQAADDHYERFIYTTEIGWIRLVLFIVSLTLTSFYVAATTFHPEMVPYRLMLSIAKAREIIPFPAIVEAFVMECMFEGLREAGVRLPKAVGSAVSIVGSLVVGQATVDAGVISAAMVIVVATSGYFYRLNVESNTEEISYENIRSPNVLAHVYRIVVIKYLDCHFSDDSSRKTRRVGIHHYRHVHWVAL